MGEKELCSRCENFVDNVGVLSNLCGDCYDNMRDNEYGEEYDRNLEPYIISYYQSDFFGG